MVNLPSEMIMKKISKSLLEIRGDYKQRKGRRSSALRHGMPSGEPILSRTKYLESNNSSAKTFFVFYS